MQTSTIMTMGTALDRALTGGFPVKLQIGNVIYSGATVSQYDGTGVVLTYTDEVGQECLAVVRVEAINAVTFRQ